MSLDAIENVSLRARIDRLETTIAMLGDVFAATMRDMVEVIGKHDTPQERLVAFSAHSAHSLAAIDVGLRALGLLNSAGQSGEAKMMAATLEANMGRYRDILKECRQNTLHATDPEGSA